MGFLISAEGSVYALAPVHVGGSRGFVRIAWQTAGLQSKPWALSKGSLLWNPYGPMTDHEYIMRSHASELQTVPEEGKEDSGPY